MSVFPHLFIISLCVYEFKDSINYLFCSVDYNLLLSLIILLFKLSQWWPLASPPSRLLFIQHASITVFKFIEGKFT